MRIFVAGATGVVGRRLLPLLREAGHRVTAVVRSGAGRSQVDRQGATAVHVDLFDAARVRAAVAGHEVVINLATHIPPSWRTLLPGAFRENDRLRHEASARLASAVLDTGAERFIQESFAPTYVAGGDRWLDETTPLDPTRYNRTVLDAEAAADRVTQSGRVGVVLRFALFYGPDSHHTIDLIRLVRLGWAPALGPAEGFVSSISTDDAATAVMSALHAAPGAYNVADDAPVRKREYVDSLAGALGVSQPRFLPGWMTALSGSMAATLSRSQRLSNLKLRGLGWAPRLPSIHEGWRAVVEELHTVGAVPAPVPG